LRRAFQSKREERRRKKIERRKIFFSEREKRREKEREVHISSMNESPGPLFLESDLFFLFRGMFNSSLFPNGSQTKGINLSLFISFFFFWSELVFFGLFFLLFIGECLHQGAPLFSLSFELR